MRPQFSIIFFTTLAGMAQGLLLGMIFLELFGASLSQEFLTQIGLPIAFILLCVGLIASFFHLGHPEKAWRAVMMWRTSWLSREVIALPLLMGTVILVYFTSLYTTVPNWLWLMLLITNLFLWLCTAKIYQSIKFIQEWAHPSTLVNFILLGITSGWILLEILLITSNKIPQNISSANLSILALLFIAIASLLKRWIWQRNKTLKPKSNLASATGIKGNNIRQISMGFMGGSFNTREFFHHKSAFFIQNIRTIVLLCAYLLPLMFIIGSMFTLPIIMLVLCLIIHYGGLIAERWLFFAEANHPQNLYYQRVA
jgi:sulfite dehydrogenase (quinone) subunit SoeC